MSVCVCVFSKWHHLPDQGEAEGECECKEVELQVEGNV